jgi:hypothetical protein
MPADISARFYQWFMSGDPTARIVAFEWWPRDGRFESSMSLGDLYFKSREDPDDVWGPGKHVGEMPWVVAQNVARSQGFRVEVAARDAGDVVSKVEGAYSPVTGEEES